ncbi:hypothetical protein LAWI1_G006846, partial [Lachnellula willkommii]
SIVTRIQSRRWRDLDFGCASWACQKRSKIAEPEWWMNLTGPLASLGLQQDADTGARTSLFCAASPDMKVEQSGTYFQQIAGAGWQSCSAKDMVLAAKLEDWTKAEMAKGNWVH